ncbi:MAG: IS110 family transposase [Gammaproteobacteria bacterium]|nr:MAG: IS110 family transposase [Gammaproteobacteria bacterium]
MYGCFEMGRDGFSPARLLTKLGIIPVPVSSTSVGTPRQVRRAKTDRLDLDRLGRGLRRWLEGEPQDEWSVVRIPPPEAEAKRQVVRERDSLVRARTRLKNKIRSVLRLDGVEVGRLSRLAGELEAYRTLDGGPIPVERQQQVRRLLEQLQVVEEQIATVEQSLAEMMASPRSAAGRQMKDLLALRGIGPVGSSGTVLEMFIWRDFGSGREVGACAGLAPTPHQSGAASHERGISKRGPRRLRALAIELAWSWVRHQPHSRLTLWWQKRWARGSRRERKIGIVAVARRLLIELWRYLEEGVVPPGALFKDEPLNG